MAFADLGVRATSLAVSAGLLGAALLAAMTMTIGLMRAEELPNGAPVMVFNEPQPPPVDPTPIRTSTATEPLAVADSSWTQPLDTPTSLTGANDFAAPFAEVGPALVANPHWRRRPSDLGRYYPERAIQRGVEGEVLLDCLVGTSGLLNCSVSQETPASWGFGEAALRISRDYQMAPATRNGVPVEGRYRMRVPFEMQ